MPNLFIIAGCNGAGKTIASSIPQKGLINIVAEGLKNIEIEIKDIATWNKIKTQANE